MRHFSADYIFTIASEPIKNGVVTVDDDGTIIEVSRKDHNYESEIEYHDGIICPGFINTHCHLELSHLRSQISKNIGIAGFIKEIVEKRFNYSKEKVEQAIINAEIEMIKNGIVAVGDISNNNSTFKQKAKSNLLYHTFVEIFAMDPTKAEETFNRGIELEKELRSLQLPCSIVPHAPYTMSEKLLAIINEHAEKSNSIISIHNQESEGESELFISKSGVLFNTFKAMGINTDIIRQTGINSLRSTLPFLKNASTLLLVHNTYTAREDIQWAKKVQSSKLESSKFKIPNSNSQLPTLFWCTCPNANKYIENRLPNYPLFIEEKATLTIGTDSLAANQKLSILDELKTIANHYPQLPLQTLLTWATKNGADCLGFNKLGTIEKGKKPGLNLLKNVDGITISKKTEMIKLA